MWSTQRFDPVGSGSVNKTDPNPYTMLIRVNGHYWEYCFCLSINYGIYCVTRQGHARVFPCSKYSRDGLKILANYFRTLSNLWNWPARYGQHAQDSVGRATSTASMRHQLLLLKRAMIGGEMSPILFQYDSDVPYQYRCEIQYPQKKLRPQKKLHHFCPARQHGIGKFISL
jgi:hypothetical protein